MPDLTDTERSVQLATTVVTNLCMYPLAKLCYDTGAFAQFWTGCFAFATSLTYHYLNTVGGGERVWGMDELTWHQLDNIFSIVCMQLMCVFLMQNEDAKWDLCLSWLYSHTTTIVQIKAPWEERWSFGPVLLAIAVLLAKCAYLRRWPVLDRSDARVGLVILAAALWFFVRGLDDATDYLRINHGMWHACIAAGNFYLFRSGLPWREQHEERTKLPSRRAR
mmetsp:Transcript_13043/g.45590  ORF Transcript_13043/g.45590 Transcript_13043/m.45590 type:complete len:221 (-) Transcript_13043:15-677(-)